MAWRSWSASAAVNPAASIAICMSCSWNSGTPSVLARLRSKQRVQVSDRLGPVAPAQVGVNRPPLDRARADEGDLDDEVVEATGPQTGQRGHLRPALDLEDPHRVAGTQHVVDGLLLGDQGEIDLVVVVGARPCRPPGGSPRACPRPKRSNFTSPAAAQSSLSHWRTVLFSMRAHSTGQTSETGRSQITMPPGWMPRWRGKPSSSVATASTRAGIPSSLAGSSGPGSMSDVVTAGTPSPPRPAVCRRPPGRPPRPRPPRSTSSNGPCGAALSGGGRRRAIPSSRYAAPRRRPGPGEWPRALAASRTADRAR